MAQCRLCREDLEVCAVPRRDGAEVPAIQGKHRARVEPLRERNDRGIGPTERKVRVALHELGHPRPIARSRRLDLVAIERSQEGGLRTCAGTPSEQVENLAQHKGGDYEVEIATPEDLDARLVRVV